MRRIGDRFVQQPLPVKPPRPTEPVVEGIEDEQTSPVAAEPPAFDVADPPDPLPDDPPADFV
jgi:hypothetical protein